MAASSLSRCLRRLQFNSRQIQFVHRRGIRHGRTLLASHDAEFEKAKERLNSLTEDPGNMTKLKMYALFKQVAVGKCNTQKPGMMDFVGKAKWEAWNELGNLTQDEAQLEYIKIVDELAGQESPTPESSSSPNVSDDIMVKKTDGICSITLNRPAKKNALTPAMYDGIRLALKNAAEDKSIVVTTMTGAGDYYCSGNDLSNFANINPDQISNVAEASRDLLNRYVAMYIDFPKLLIGIINGPAVGVSVTVLGLFDAVYAVDSASFHTPFTSLGQSAEGCSSYVFPKLMGNVKANEMLMYNRKLSAFQACERGLVSEVFPAESFAREVETRVREMAKLPPQSVAKSKALVRDTDRATLHAVNDRECDLLQERWQSEECMNAIMKFFQRKSNL